ncbi:unnamed protein product [Staurois parvus]|uniref:Uncharacterized protein n=1 Tax=Staurois parvus TaxID=386267 RepID=A0ABN9A9V9_9NEOB|nr:unnamed protein product [Staurois parvus]
MIGTRWFSRSGRTSYDVLPFSPCMRGSVSAHARRSAVRCPPRTQRITDPRKEPKMSARSCDQLCPITADRV